MVYQGKIIISGIRGMFLDMSEVVNKTPLGKEAFDGMNNLQYLKFYNSCFPRESEADCKFNFPDGLKLPLQEIRYFHWLKFPEEELPQHFNPKNLIDLKLPYSKIKRLWDSVKVRLIRSLITMGCKKKTFSHSECWSNLFHDRTHQT